MKNPLNEIYYINNTYVENLHIFFFYRFLLHLMYKN